MRTQVLFQTLLSVCLLIATTCYGQTGYKLEDLKVEKTGYDLQGTLRISQSYDKQTKMLLVVVLMPVRQMDTPMQSICTVGVGHTQQVEPLKAGNQKVHFL